jgi:hypothetical protein
MKNWGIGIFAATLLIAPAIADEEVAEVAEIAEAAEVAEAEEAAEAEKEVSSEDSGEAVSESAESELESEAETSEEVVPAEPEAVDPSVKSRSAAPPKRTYSAAPRASSAARVSLMGPGMRSPTTPAPVVAVSKIAAAAAPVEDIECGIGEYPKDRKCVPCDQKNNPGIKWQDQGKNCKVSECVSSDYVLIDKDKEHPKCLQKCDVWGGAASREWIRDDADFSFCGSGKFLECESGFAKTREQTASSGTEAGHCVVEGTMTGKCKTDGQMKPGKFAHGHCMQICENGYWSGCTISRFCESGFSEIDFKEVVLVKDKKDAKASSFKCGTKGW